MVLNPAETHANQVSIFVIEKTTDSNQLLVKLCRNKKMWLSPIGWSDQEKGTLLDCRSVDGKTEIEIPAGFAKDIKSGDVLHLRCPELDHEQEMTWDAASVKTRSDAPVPVKEAGGLLARIKGKPKEVVVEPKSDTQKRADDAQRAAENYKAKMEAATAAKEVAHKQALEAARQAEEALKMEASRIAEMERAAQAFEEAERLRQDEVRRLEEEKRIEAARLEEERRIAEAARLRELEARLQAERDEARKNHAAALETARVEEKRLKARLDRLRKESKNVEAIVTQNKETWAETNEQKNRIDEKLGKQAKSYSLSEAKLNDVSDNLLVLKSESDATNALKADILSKIGDADIAYSQAQKAAEAAIAIADKRRAELEALRHEEITVSASVNDYVEKLDGVNRRVTDASVKAQKLKAKLDAVQAEQSRYQMRMDAMSKDQALHVENSQKLRLEMEAVRQAIEDTDYRQSEHQKAIIHLESGGNPDEIKEISLVRASDGASLVENDLDSDFAKFPARVAGVADRVMGNVRRSFSRNSDPKISIEVDHGVTDIEDENVTVATAKDDGVKNPGFDLKGKAAATRSGAADYIKKTSAAGRSGSRRLRQTVTNNVSGGVATAGSFYTDHKSGLVAASAILGGLVILAGGYTISQNMPKTEVVVNAETVPATEVASALASPIESLDTSTDIDLSGTELPAVLDPVDEEAAVEVGPEANNMVTPEVTKTAAVSVDLAPTIEPTIELTAPVVAAVDDDTEAATIIAWPKAVERVVDVQTEPKPKARTRPAARPVTKTAELKIDIPEKVEPLTAPAIAAEPEVAILEPVIAVVEPIDATVDETVDDKAALLLQAQTRLAELGFYRGAVNGQPSLASDAAIRQFKTIVDLPLDNSISGAMLKALDEVTIRTPEPQQVAEVAPPVVRNLAPVETVPVIAEPLQMEATAPVAVTPVAPEVQKTVADIVVDAVAIGKTGAVYPQVALRREVYVNANIMVQYDVAPDGSTVNVKMRSSDYAGRYSDRFVKAALEAVEKQRFEPKTVNGVAVTSEGHQRRIAFRVE